MTSNKRIEVEHQRDFTGGLNLATDPYSIDRNESFDCVNVDIHRDGGFGLRRGIRPHISVATGFTAGSAADTLFTYVDGSAVRHLIACFDSHTRRFDGAAWQDIRVAVPGSASTQFAVMNGNLYFTNQASSGGVHKWAGAGLSTSLPAPVFNDNLAAPVGGRFPQSYALCVHNNSMFSGIGDRVRWSHPLFPEDWRTNDWIDLNPGDDTGKIRAMASFRQQLLVFKNSSVHAINGFPPGGLSPAMLSSRVGASTPQGVTVAEDAVYFWDAKTGLWKYDGEKFEWVFEKVFPWLDDNRLNVAFSHQARVQYFNRRVFVSVPWSAEPYAGDFVTLVFAPDVGQRGAWTFHDTPTNTFHSHAQGSGGDNLLLGSFNGRVYQYDCENVFSDELVVGAPEAIRAHYTTRWFDARNPALKKRWKRPVIVARSEQNTMMFVDVFSDYDPTTVSKTFALQTSLDDAELVWDVLDWDEADWAAEVGDRSEALRGAQLGPGIAKALRFKNGTTSEFIGQNWRVHGVTMKWISKRIRN